MNGKAHNTLAKPSTGTTLNVSSTSPYARLLRKSMHMIQTHPIPQVPGSTMPSYITNIGCQTTIFGSRRYLITTHQRRENICTGSNQGISVLRESDRLHSAHSPWLVSQPPSPTNSNNHDKSTATSRLRSLKSGCSSNLSSKRHDISNPQ